ncbi:MAG: hydrogenase formation protein HypD [Candidatus Omnitrophota bacterium]
MKFVDEYRDVGKSKKLSLLINKEAGSRPYKIMEVCGTHTAAICRFGIKAMLPDSLKLISGPGCPVCVTSDGYLKNALKLAERENTIIASYSDMFRVPVGTTSLEKAASGGCDIRGVNSALEALEVAALYPQKEVVFLGVGFETTAPGSAIAIKSAIKKKIKNFSVYCSHKTIPEALSALALDKSLLLNGFLLPGHVSAVIGLKGYENVLGALRTPSVITGFEPLDILFAIYKIVCAVNAGEPLLENGYKRVVQDQGNVRAQELLDEVFEQKDGFWRGIGIIPQSEFSIRKKFQVFDASKRFGLKKEDNEGINAGCRCADVLKGKINPSDCGFFAKKCTPQTPKGPCMVSREGSCRAFFEYR